MTDWLPELIPVNPWTHDTYDVLYDIFCQDIKDYDLRYCECKVWIFPEKEDGKELLFWHLTSRKVNQTKIPRRKKKFTKKQPVHELDRFPDMRRCERLSWIKALIEHPLEPEILTWDYEEGNLTIKTYIWLKNLDFVVIMKKYHNGSRRLITSFYIDKEYKRMDFERKYINRIK